jgi:predicted component of type VI protein secretion system
MPKVIKARRKVRHNKPGLADRLAHKSPVDPPEQFQCRCRQQSPVAVAMIASYPVWKPWRAAVGWSSSRPAVD